MNGLDGERQSKGKGGREREATRQETKSRIYCGVKLSVHMSFDPVSCLLVVCATDSRFILGGRTCRQKNGDTIFTCDTAISAI